MANSAPTGSEGSQAKGGQTKGRAKLTYGGRVPMPLEDRAKIFSPFDPLDGFRDALRAKEQEVESARTTY